MLGDRVRMQAHAQDAGVFIRSMATRGHLGGLARATADAALVLDAAGKDVVVIETVGVGQDEVDIARTADVSVVVLVPGMGDDVQALKAGVMEIADMFVVNKSDRDGADRAVAEIESLLGLHAYREGEWRPPIVRTQRNRRPGARRVMATIERFRGTNGAASRTARLARRRRSCEPSRGRRDAAGRVARDRPRRWRSWSIASRRDPSIRTALPTPSDGGPHAPAGRRMKAILDHVGIAGRDLDASLAFFRDALGLEVERAGRRRSQRVRAQFISTGAASLELLQATAPDSPIAKFLEKRGPGLHHITLQSRRHRRGAGTAARSAACGSSTTRRARVPRARSVAFIHPSSAQGVLVELKQAGDRHRPRRRSCRKRSRSAISRS